MTEEQLKELEAQVAVLEAEKRERDEKSARREGAVKGQIVYTREDLIRGNFDPAKIKSGAAVVKDAPAIPIPAPAAAGTPPVATIKYSRADLAAGRFDPAKIVSGEAIVEG